MDRGPAVRRRGRDRGPDPVRARRAAGRRRGRRAAVRHGRPRRRSAPTDDERQVEQLGGRPRRRGPPDRARPPTDRLGRRPGCLDPRPGPLLRVPRGPRVGGDRAGPGAGAHRPVRRRRGRAARPRPAHHGAPPDRHHGGRRRDRRRGARRGARARRAGSGAGQRRGLRRHATSRLDHPRTDHRPSGPGRDGAAGRPDGPCHVLRRAAAVATHRAGDVADGAGHRPDRLRRRPTSGSRPGTTTLGT